MATATRELIHVLRQTQMNLKVSTSYEWGHMGACNCGFLAQEISNLNKAEIHRRAMERSGDWSEQLNDYCPTSGILMDDLISALIHQGFTLTDLRHLERLSDSQILQTLPIEARHLRYNVKEDVLLYLEAWLKLLEDQLIASETPQITKVSEYEFVY